MLGLNLFQNRNNSATMPKAATTAVAAPQNTTDFASSRLSCTIAKSAALCR